MTRYVSRYNTRYAKAGMQLANPIISSKGAIIAQENSILTESLIERLVAMGINFVDVFEISQNNAGHQEAEKQKRLFDTHSEITTTSYTFTHSVNVAVICGLIWRWLGNTETSEMVLAGLLHDFGKTQIPLEILNKPDKLSETEMQIMRQHPILGLEMCKNDQRIPECVLAGIIEHHERLDGSGYPFGLTEERISPFGKIVAIADTYDAMTSNRVYRQAVTPFSVLTELFSEMFGKLDAKACTSVIDNLKETLIGYNVRLSDGTIAKVIYIDRSRQFKPLVETENGRYLNLECTEFEIAEVISR
ncbi:MAG: rpfG 3 [Firmicutes bacterium]|nr:rpfG 3 [Bacillota bacterium]